MKSLPFLMFGLLRSTPNLENLVVQIGGDGKLEIGINEEFLNAQWTGGMCANLQVVEIWYFSWSPIEMSFVKLMLSKARFLRTLNVEPILSVSYEVLNELLEYRRGSAQAQV